MFCPLRLPRAHFSSLVNHNLLSNKNKTKDFKTVRALLHNKMAERIWKPFDYTNYAMILLNQPVQDEKHFITLWNNASIRMLVDGGANRWQEIKSKNPETAMPQIISGDFDSIASTILEQFRKLKNDKELEIVETPDQDETDFTKAIRILGERMKNHETPPEKIIAFCESSGRFDQIMANVETLFHSLLILSPDKHLCLHSSTSITWLLRKDSKNKILLGEVLKNSPNLLSPVQIHYCSLIPVGSPSVVTTHGLKWDLNGGTLAFGQLVSTSNKPKKNGEEYQDILVTTSEPVLWSMEVEF